MRSWSARGSSGSAREKQAGADGHGGQRCWVAGTVQRQPSQGRQPNQRSRDAPDPAASRRWHTLDAAVSEVPSSTAQGPQLRTEGDVAALDSDGQLAGGGPDKELLKAASVTSAFTVQGPQQALAMLLGLKLIENRAWRITPGWYALHVGAQRNSEWGLRAAETYPELPSEDQLGHFFSSVVGLLHIAEQRSTDQCGSHCWAYGPVCHVVSHAVQLPVPLPQRGAQGLWPLPDALRRRIQEQVRSISAKQELSAQVSFRDWWAPGGVLRCHDLTELGPLSTRPPAAQEPAQAQPPRFSLHMAASSSTTPREPLLSQTYVMRGARSSGP